MSQNKPSKNINIYKKWLDTSIQEGTIYCCPKSDIKVDPRPIGIGAFGMVQKATVKRFRFPKSIFGKKHFLSGMTVAVKTLILATNSNGEDLYGLFVRELKNHRQANSHPNIIRFLGLCKDKNDYHMIFELADGGTLREHLEKHFKDLSWKDKYKLGLEIVDGLRYIHSLGIIHKDLSSKNILIQLGIAKLTDFGLSSVLKQMSPSHGLGTLRYQDPASFTDELYRRGKKSDIFSLGVLLWEISTGKIPCEGRTENATIIACRLKGYRDPPFVGTPEEYVDVYSECWNEDPDERPFCENVYKRLKILEYRDALSDFNRVLELEPNDVSALKNRGAVYLNLEQYDDALNDFNKSLELEPDNPLALSVRGTVYINFKQYDKALNDFNKSLAIEPMNANALRNRGRVYLDLKRYDKVLDDLNQSLTIEPSDAWALSTRGAVYLMLERYDDALSDFNTSLKIKQNDTWTLSRRGSVYRNLKQYDNALKDFNNSLDIEPDGSWALSERGAVYYYLEKYEDALKDFSKSLDIEPNNTWALSIRGAVYLNLKQYDNAFNDIQKSLEIEPDNTWTLSIRGTVLFNLRQGSLEIEPDSSRDIISDVDK